MPTRLALVVAFFAASLTCAGRARAQATQPTINVGTVVLELGERTGSGNDDSFQLLNQMDQDKFFNNASCLCGDETQFTVRLSLTGVTSVSSDIQAQIWLGSGCSDNSDLVTRNANCEHYKNTNIRLSDFQSRNMLLDISAKDLMFPNKDCTSATGSNTVWALIDTNNDNLWDTGGIFQLSSAGAATSIHYDTAQPVNVSDAKVEGVEDGFAVSWSASAGDITSLRGYQILCKWTKSGQPVFKTPRGKGTEYIRTTEQGLNGQTCTVDPPAFTTGSTSSDAGVANAIDAGVVDDDAGVLDDDAGVAVADAGTTTTPDAGTVTGAADTFETLAPRFRCSDLVGSSSEGFRIDISNPDDLTEDATNQTITAAIVSIDKNRNYNAVITGDSGKTVPVRDGWEYYHDQGGTADGGYCFVATAAYGHYDHLYVKVLRRFRDETLAPFGWGRGFIAWYYAHSPPWADFLRAHPVARVTAAILLFPVVVLAAVWNALGPVGLVGLALAFWALRRFRRSRRAVLATAGSVTLVLLLVGSSARAQSWLDEEDMRREKTGPEDPHWLFEFKLGPYFPDIDGEAGVTGRPYEVMFGSGSSLLLQAELDYFPFHVLGELGVGVSAGWMSNRAKAFKQDSNGMALACAPIDPACRSSDDTSFTMFPLALLAVYRFTELADRTVVPIVPYAKVGLSYYIWRITKGNGDLSNFMGQEGAGGTLGWQASIGISIRADGLDPDSAKAMRSDLGVDHIGFFFEATFADVSGLAQSNKLHLGDLTYAGGLNFEF